MDIYMVWNVFIKRTEIEGIRNFRRYFINSLYNETLTYHFNEGCESRWAEKAIERDFGYSA